MEPATIRFRRIQTLCFKSVRFRWRCGFAMLTACSVKLSYNYTHTHPFNSPLSRATWVGRNQKGKTNVDFTEAGDSEWQWYQLGHMQDCTSFQADNHARTPPLSFLQAGCPSCRPTNSVKALKALKLQLHGKEIPHNSSFRVSLAHYYLLYSASHSSQK